MRFDERYLRPTEVDNLIGDASKAARGLGWKPQTLTPELARLMVDADMGDPRQVTTALDHRRWQGRTGSLLSRLLAE